jgi:hypothetical protein
MNPANQPPRTPRAPRIKVKQNRRKFDLEKLGVLGALAVKLK